MRRLGLLLAVLVLVLVLVFRRGSLVRTQGDGWTAAAPGIEMRTVSAPDEGGGSAASIVAIRVSAGRVGIVSDSLQDAAGWCAREGAAAAVNGGFFDAGGSPVGLLITGGKIRRRLNRASGGIFFLRASQAQILSAPQFARSFPLATGITAAVECGPLLVEDGQPKRLKPQFARRTGIGIQRDGRVVIAVCDTPLSLSAWSRAWASAAGLNCRQALNLDGGPSTQLSVTVPGHNLQIPGGWPVPDAVVVK